MQVKHSLLVLILLLNFVPLSSAQDARPIVKMIYFLPKDREPRPDIDEKMDRFIKDVQQFYGDQMEAHEFDRKTFLFETDADGKAVVHRVIGQHTDKYYIDLPHTWDIWEEIENQFDMSRTYYLTVIDISIGSVSTPSRSHRVAGLGGTSGGAGGRALVAASSGSFNSHVISHELGHAFGLLHDYYRSNHNLVFASTFDKDDMTASFCAAEWLNAHRAFNPIQPTANVHTKVEMLPPSLAAPPYAIRLRFKVSDPDGLHQVQLLTSELSELFPYGGGLLACKQVNGVSQTIEFVTTDLTPKNRYVYLQVIDINGNFSRSKFYPIDVSALLPPPEVVSIPDPQLAAAVRESLDLVPNAAITTHTMQYLRRFYAPNSGITDLTGLEHAHNLTYLNLGGEYIDQKVANSNSVSDFSPLAELTQLRTLDLDDSSIADVSPLAELTQLRELYLADNSITNVAPLAELTQLTTLDLSFNNIIDVSPLAELTQLRELYLAANNIADVSPLAELTQLRTLHLGVNNIADVAPLVGLNLTGTEREIGLRLMNNPLSYASINIHIPAIQAKGFKVAFYAITHPALQKISGDSQEDFAGKVLSSPFVVEVVDEKGEPMPGVSVTFTINAGAGKLTDTTTMTDADGNAQTTLIFGGIPGITKVRVSAEGIKSEAIFTATVILPENHVAADVNADAVVDIEDLVLVAATIGMTPPEGILPNTDVNGDGIVNEEDIALVLAALEAALASPASVWTAANLQRWIDKAKQHNIRDATFRQGIAVLEQLLATLQPKATALLANYPNPFNPETWIPYHLAQPAEVTLQIHAINGALVRTLILGHQPAGIYEHRRRAAYWDGRNEQSERVASGIYFYTITAGDFTATRKMLIWK